MRGAVAKELRRAARSLPASCASEIELQPRGNKWFTYKQDGELKHVLLAMHQRRWKQGCAKSHYKSLKRLHRKYGP